MQDRGTGNSRQRCGALPLRPAANDSLRETTVPEHVKPGDWVRIHLGILRPGERAPGIPPDTAAHPYEAWINGWACEEACLGGPATIRTPAGRIVRGTLAEAHPGYSHGFGRPHPALLAVGLSLKESLKEGND
jgi:hypothetical protein